MSKLLSSLNLRPEFLILNERSRFEEYLAELQKSDRVGLLEMLKSRFDLEYGQVANACLEGPGGFKARMFWGIFKSGIDEFLIQIKGIGLPTPGQETGDLTVRILSKDRNGSGITSWIERDGVAVSDVKAEGFDQPENLAVLLAKTQRVHY